MSCLTNRVAFCEECLLWHKDSELVRCKLWKGNKDWTPPNELWKMLWETGQGCSYWGALRRCFQLPSSVPFRGSSSNILDGQSEILKKHFDHFWTDSNNKAEWEKCDFGGWVGGMVGALHICATLWYDEGVFVSKTLLFSNWFKIKLMKMEKQYFRSCLDGVWRREGGIKGKIIKTFWRLHHFSNMSSKTNL